MDKKSLAGLLMIIGGIGMTISAFIPEEGSTPTEFWLRLASGALFLGSGFIFALGKKNAKQEVSSANSTAG